MELGYKKKLNQKKKNLKLKLEEKKERKDASI
jgi:hypothetical protein